MQFTININQLLLASTSLDLIDAAILDYLYHYCNSKSDAVRKNRIKDEEGNEYTWIDYTALLRDMPLLRISRKGALTPRIQRLADAGFILTKKGYRFKLYVCLTELVDGLHIRPNAEESENVAFTKTNADNHVSVHENKRQRSRKRTDYYTNNYITNSILAKPKKDTSSKNVENKDPLPTKRNGEKSRKGMKSIREIIVEKTNPVTGKNQVTMQFTLAPSPVKTEHQAYGLKVMEDLALPKTYTARVIKAVRLRPLHVIEKAISKTYAANISPDTDRAKYFFKVLQDKRQY